MGKSQVITCDRCGKNIVTAGMEDVGDWIQLYINYHGIAEGIPESVILCSCCKDEFMTFIRSKDPTKYLKTPKILNKGSYKDNPVYLCPNPKCRKNVKREQNFCSNCGTPLDWKLYDDDMRNESNEEVDNVSIECEVGDD